MKLSVLMCVYRKNEPRHFRSALSSVWTDQIRKPDQIVLVKDGPLSAELEHEISEFKRLCLARIDIVSLAENQGITKALNEGIPVCSGDLIARMDADDIALPERFRTQIEFMSQNPEIDVLGGGLQEFDDHSECLFTRFYPTNHQAIVQTIHKGSPFAHPTVVFRRRIFDDGFRYNQFYRTSQDIELWFRLIEGSYLFANLPSVLVRFRIDENFAARRSKQKAMNEFKIYWNGIIQMHGWNWRLGFPILRLAFRYAPKQLTKIVYFSGVRKFLNSK